MRFLPLQLARRKELQRLLQHDSNTIQEVASKHKPEQKQEWAIWSFPQETTLSVQNSQPSCTPDEKQAADKSTHTHSVQSSVEPTELPKKDLEHKYTAVELALADGLNNTGASNSDTRPCNSAVRSPLPARAHSPIQAENKKEEEKYDTRKHLSFSENRSGVDATFEEREAQYQKNCSSAHVTIAQSVTDELATGTTTKNNAVETWSEQNEQIRSHQLGRENKEEAVDDDTHRDAEVRLSATAKRLNHILGYLEQAETRHSTAHTQYELTDSEVTCDHQQQMRGESDNHEAGKTSDKASSVFKGVKERMQRYQEELQEKKKTIALLQRQIKEVCALLSLGLDE